MSQSVESSAIAGMSGHEPRPDVPARQRLLDGMAIAIATSGYRGATITEVVRYARVSKRTFYEEFDDKEACFLELYDRTAEALETLITDAARLDLPWREQIRAGARAYYTALTSAPLLTRAFFIEIGTISPEATARRRSAIDHFVEVIRGVVDEGRRRNPEIRSRPLTPAMGLAVVGGMTEVMIAAIEEEAMTERLDELVDTCTDLFASVVTGRFPEDN